MPDVDSAISKTVDVGSHILIGLSPALMLQGDYKLEEKLDELIYQSISGFGVVLLDHCEQVLQKFIRRDKRTENRILFVDGEISSLPQIKLTENNSFCVNAEPFPNFSSFIKFMEQATGTQIKRHSEITITTSFDPKLFSLSIYPVKKAIGAYESLQQRDIDIANFTQKSYGTDEQWNWLVGKMSANKNLTDCICNYFSSTSNLSVHLADVMNSKNKNKKWFLFLSLKIFGEPGNSYLTYVLNNSESYSEFENNLYLALTEIDFKKNNSDFRQMYEERKALLKKFPANMSLLQKYVELIGKYQKKAIFYLTDGSEIEKFKFMEYLSIYNYDEEELKKAVQQMSKSLSLYMQDFIFDSLNTTLSENDSGFRTELNFYFKNYKIQKLTNKIFPEFLNVVNKYADYRPYNKLQPRSNIISQIDKKNKQLFFFDALGVEYLSFILAKCEEYGLLAEIFIGHCEPPSITENNKEFLEYFSAEQCFNIKGLDEIKHHSQEFNYQKLPHIIFMSKDETIFKEVVEEITEDTFLANIELLLTDN